MKQRDNRKDNLKIAGIVLILIFWIFSCRHESTKLEMLDEVCFEKEILPIFQISCATSGCHVQGGSSAYIFTTYEGIIRSVVPGEPFASPSYKSLVNIWSEEKMMPPGEPLSEYNRTLIRVWIEQGAKNILCKPIDSSTYENPRACFQRDILPVLLSNCAMSGCHDNLTAEEGYRFTNYTNTLKAVNISNPASSKLYDVITETNPEDIMPPPPRNPLTNSQTDSVLAWIRYGALDEFCGVACDTGSVMSFATNIWPVIENSCKGCHSGTSPNGGISLTSYSEVAVIAASGKLTGTIKRLGGYVPMPPSGPLPDCKIKQIDLWVQNGYPDN